MESWPEKNYPLARLNLYVQADQAKLWEVWAESQFSELAVRVSGIQHFSMQDSKNSADIAIVADAVGDFVSGATKFVAVMSDDSDFMALYVKLKELTVGKPPFLWVMTDRDRTRSATIKSYFPNDHRHVVSLPSRLDTSLASHDGIRDNSNQFKEMANLIVEQFSVGTFKSTDCQPIIKKHWPNHPMASMSGPQFGIEFGNKIWPILNELGVERQETKPRKYEVT